MVGASAGELLKKYGVKVNTNKRPKDPVAKRAAEIVKNLNEKVAAKGPSRNDLMLQAKAAGIKNFRILNKEELQKVLDPMTTGNNQIEIIRVAIERWKSGWGSRKPKEVASA